MSEISEKIKCLIIGSGPAGYTAAIYAARADLKPVLYTGLKPGGQLTDTTEVDNFPGYPDGTMGPEMMIDLQKQAERFGTDVRFGYVTKCEFSSTSQHKIIIDEKKIISADSVIISTGASAKWLGLESEKRLNGFGVSACAVCDGFFYKGEEVVVVGAGDTAAEEATYLAKLCKKVTILVRKSYMRASKAMQHKVANTKNIKVLFNTETLEILGEKNVVGVKVNNNKTNKISSIKCTGFFVAIGHKPNSDLFINQLDMDENGYLITKPDSTKTNIKGVFAAGDIQDKIYRQAVTAAGSGCMAALESERYLSEIENNV
ncbi:MAG: thioredoxin-disulfide reductase [Flavobacteriales bacterium TMED288]|nr:thioredoxin-disulfide reductase [Flavobacteriales bacterium]RPG53312.1 MAG: thioredoxin-disulfide reductase [Flavobacteriales bacterium TMED288]|tara:strand:- start:2713 stop:3663 length:951 start_codon:yes stop_codon:yes gene_type:complete